MQALLVPPTEIPSIWHEVKPLMKKALNGEEEIIPDDLLEPLLNAKVFMWIAVDGDQIETVLLCEIVDYPRKKSCYIHVLATKSGYRFEELTSLFDNHIINFAKINGCDFIEAKVRKGLAKKLTHWNDKHSLITLTI